LGGKRAKHEVILLYQRHNAEKASNAENKTLKILWLGAGREYNKKNYSKENKF
jgi:hypothetical protein